MIQRIYYDVKFEDKEKIKAFGGRWDTYYKKWYVFNNNVNKDEINKIFTTISI